MNKYDDRVAKALQDVSNDCGHPQQDRGMDVDTADEFCGNCGRVTDKYVPGTVGRFPGNRASDAIVEQLKAEFPDQLGFFRLFYVEPVARDEFQCYVQVNIDGKLQHRYYNLTREGADENVQVKLDAWQ